MTQNKTSIFRTHLPGFYKTLFFLALPIILQQLMQTFVNMLDTIMVGQLGTAEVAAVGLGNQIFFMLNMILFGTASGGSVFIAGIQKVLGIMISFSSFVCILFFTGAFFIPDVLLSLYTKDTVVIAYGAKYLRYISVSYLFLAVSFPFGLSMRAVDHAMLPTVCSAIAIVLNIAFNYIFIFGFDFSLFKVEPMGVAGAAIGTIVARAAETLIMMTYANVRKFEILGPVKNFLNFDRKMILKYVSVALPVLLNESLWGLGITFENSIFAHTGTVAIAAFNITGTVSQLAWVFLIGVGNAAGIILGRKIGAGALEETKLYAYRFVWFVPCVAVFCGMLLFPFSAVLPHFFKGEDFDYLQIARDYEDAGASAISILTEPYFFKGDDEVLYLAKIMLRELAFFYPFNSFCMYFIVGFCRAGGDTKFAAFHDLFWMWCIAIPSGAVAAFVFHASPLVIYPVLLSEGLFKCTVGILRLKSGKWLKDVTG